jgi:hypothetical protein
MQTALKLAKIANAFFEKIGLTARFNCKTLASIIICDALQSRVTYSFAGNSGSKAQRSARLQAECFGFPSNDNDGVEIAFGSNLIERPFWIFS